MLKLLTSVAIVSALSAVSISATPAAGDSDRDLDPDFATSVRAVRVRSADTRAAALLVEGLERSATMRALVTQIEQRDVIVYVAMQPALRQRLAGTMTWVTATGAHRYVRISINPELSTDLAISTIGHELQHALEVANAPQIVSERTLAAFYRLHGNSSNPRINGWDTEAARVAGIDVRRELASAAGRMGTLPTARVTDSIQEFSPDDWFVVYRRARSMLPP